MEENGSRRPSTSVFMTVFVILLAMGNLTLLIAANMLVAYLFTVLMLPVGVTAWLILTLAAYAHAKKRGADDLPAFRTRLAVAVSLFAFIAVLIVLFTALVCFGWT